MNDFFKSQMWPVITLLIGGVFQFLLTLANDKMKDKKDKEKDRRKYLKNSYDYILKYINKIPIITTKDILNNMKDPNAYRGMTTDEIIYNLANESIFYSKQGEDNYEDLKECDDYIELLENNLKEYNEAVEIESQFKTKEYHNFTLYAPRSVIDAWTSLRAIVDKGFELNDAGEYEAFIVNTDDKYHDNVFVDAYEELYEAIRKDLDVKIDNDIISKYKLRN